jgi:hypothetical protein
MIIHKPVQIGTTGKIDSWGYGSWARVWAYPTLGLSRVITTGPTGGIMYPTIQGVDPEFVGLPDHAPLIHWGDYSPTYYLPDGRVLVARLIDGERCFIEVQPDNTEA